MKFLKIDESGKILENDHPLGPEDARSVLESLHLNSWGAFECDYESAIVEVFDEPLVVQSLRLEAASQSGRLSLTAGYGFEFESSAESLTVDEWDRFHGLSLQGIPFVLSPKAQNELFDQVDSFDDDFVEIDEKKFFTPPWLSSKTELSENPFWNHIYQTESPGWEIEMPSPPLAAAIPSLKIPKSRVLVLGCGSGEDAALMARAGHAVTAVDFSEEAIGRAQKKHGDLGIQWHQQDALQLQDAWIENFDIIIEHTFYCAIQPERRNELVQLWRRYLTPGGFLIGVFFSMEKPLGPPFGGSEWEIRERLRPHLQFLNWQRCRNSLKKRMGKEVLLVAQKPWK